ncbi:hypothetical protein KFL_001840230 [Klebsormidium nitens]|uniref:RING-CH-type domain-containing protein n=1 Tax=Klebsormidium nitens TaxID=105231 RepID=A0A1Y1I085_KLENI|nr:hypothetical protein KFL_001840230 [Klebsormidium nitens]|eukprot:GAQ84324.1 hypothetical protein KFL_001840230 [Klebsormidium nitens]
MLVLDCGCHSKGLAIMHSECALLWFSYQQTRTCEICQKPVKNLPNVLDPSLKPKKSATSRHPPRPPAEPRVPPRQDSLAERMLRCFVDLCSPDEEQSKARRRAGASSIHAPARALRV